MGVLLVIIDFRLGFSIAKHPAIGDPPMKTSICFICRSAHMGHPKKVPLLFPASAPGPNSPRDVPWSVQFQELFAVPQLN